MSIIEGLKKHTDAFEEIAAREDALREERTERVMKVLTEDCRAIIAAGIVDELHVGVRTNEWDDNGPSEGFSLVGLKTDGEKLTVESYIWDYAIAGAQAPGYVADEVQALRDKFTNEQIEMLALLTSTLGRGGRAVAEHVYNVMNLESVDDSYYGYATLVIDENGIGAVSYYGD